MKLKLRLLTLLIFIMSTLHGQTNLQQFYALADKNDTVGEVAFLQKWESANTDDPDLYIAWFNYYYQVSSKEIINISTNTKINSGFKVVDPETQKRVGTLYGEITYLPEKVLKAFEYIDKGINKYPSRLDMRFGKVFLLGQIRYYRDFTNEIITTIHYSDSIKNNWIWKDNKPLEDPKNLMLETIHTYMVQLYDTGIDSLLGNMADIANTVLKYYPDHIESINDLSITFLLRKQYPEAIAILQKAVKIAPSDCVVLGNMAEAYKLSGDIEDAIRYYNLIIFYGNKKQVEDAKNRLKNLNQK